MTPDIYDEAVAYLTEHGGIYDAWNDPDGGYPGGILFRKASDGRQHLFIDGICGCLTQIADYNPDRWDRWCPVYVAQTQELTDAIRLDKRIPTSGSLIEVSDLPIFAEWQRRIDKELGREVPKGIA